MLAGAPPGLCDPEFREEHREAHSAPAPAA
jgi:hypothetical protein